MISTTLFYLFSSVLLLAAMMVVASKNPVHSVLFLILAFFNAAGLFLLLGAEFAAFILVIVYVGAVAVLFLFVVMMLDIDFEQLRKGALKSLPVGVLVGVVLVAQLVMTAANWHSVPNAAANIASPPVHTDKMVDGKVVYSAKGLWDMKRDGAAIYDDKTAFIVSGGKTNTQAIGQILYTDYVYPFQVAGLILLVAMIGAIVLTLRERTGVLRQNINSQITRERKNVIEIRKVEKGAGI
jgi:NADH-quinone oxidoreductase subunit J